MTTYSFQRAAALVLALFIFAAMAFAQSGSVRPRRVNLPPAPVTQPDSNVTTNSPPPRSSNAPLLDTSNTPSTANSTSAETSPSTTNTAASTLHAYSLLQQKQYAAAASEAKQIAASDPNNAEAWKVAGFAEFNLKRYADAATDLQRALDLQRAAKREDANTVDALAQAYARMENFERALPLLVAATSRAGAQPDAVMLYYRGYAEYKTGKAQDAERSFNAAVKANPKDALSLYYLGQIAFDRNDMDAAIAALNRATLNDARLPAAWGLLTTAYLRRAAAATVQAKAEADYLSAVRAGEGLTRVATDAQSTTLFAQALIGAKQYARAATVLERVAVAPDTPAVTLYLLGVSYSRSNNLPKAISAFERAAQKTPDDVNIYRELGYAYEVSKQYSKALDAYQKGAALAPNDADLKASVERVKPFAK